MPNQMNNQPIGERITGLILAIFVVITFVFFLFRPPEFSDATLFLLRFLAALASGLSAYLFTGSLEIEGSLSKKFQIRAAGAFAAFIMVFLLFLWDPTHKNPTPVSPTSVSPTPVSPTPDDKGTVYADLEKYLEEKKWKKADQETYNVMLKVTKREQQGFIDSDTIEDEKRLPCESLRFINERWFKSSNKKFGFSVQKNIYQDLGGSPDFEGYDEQIWEKFGDRVGWRKNGEWIANYNDLTFSLENSPDGHLPTFWKPNSTVPRKFGRDHKLLARIDSCNF